MLATLGQQPEASYLLSPGQAVQLALIDAAGLPEHDRPHTLYLWLVLDASKEAQAAISYGPINTALSHASLPVLPVPVANGRLLRVNLLRLLPDPKDYQRTRKLLEDYHDPYFHVQACYRVPCPPYTAADGKRYDYRDGFRKGFGLHIRPDHGAVLSKMLGTATPIIRADLFLVRSLSTLEAYGGIYYDLRGIEDKPAKGTAFEAFLARIGADLKSSQASDTINRAGLFKSRVTAKPRRGEFFFGTKSRPTDGPAFGMATFDIADGDRKAGQHPVRNLLNFEFRASEVFIQRNGRIEFGLFNAAGARQDSVPENIARDHTVPAPQTAVLQGAIACLRCHGPHDLYQPFPNDVQTLLGTAQAEAPAGRKMRLNIFDDVSSNLSPEKVVDQLAGQYGGDLAGPLQQAREDHFSWAWKTTGGIGGDGASAFATGKTAEIFGRYLYDDVTAERACIELGVQPGKDAAATFRKAVPLLPPNVLGYSNEDPIIAALRGGQSVVRADWEHVYADAAIRAAAATLEQASK